MKRKVSFGIFASACLLTQVVGTANADEVAARLGDREIKISEVDQTGGSNLYDASQALYEARVRSLYKILADQAFSVEAKKRNISVAALTDIEVIDKTNKVTDVDIDTVIKSKNLDLQDPQLRRKVSIALVGERSNKRRNEYLAELFKAQGLSVSLPTPGDPPREDIRGENNLSKGPATAGVEIVVFSDFQCPYCRQMADTLEQAAQQYPKEIRIVYRFFPVHTDSTALAEAALCADDQGKFWEYHNALFRDPKVMAGQIDPIGREIGLNMEKFQACNSNHKHRPRVLADQTEATRLGVNGTPTLFVNNVRMRGGALSFARLNVEIRNALNRVATSGRSTTKPGG